MALRLVEVALHLREVEQRLVEQVL